MIVNTKKKTPFEIIPRSARTVQYNYHTCHLYLLKVLPHVMRNINEFNIPVGNLHGYEILYFGVNLILMFDYRLAFDI